MYQRHLRSLWTSLEGSGFTIFSHDWVLREDKPTWGSSATRGLFFVFEGLDRSGKSTQSKKLEEYLSKAGTGEPNKGIQLKGPLPHQESLKVGVFYWNIHHISPYSTLCLFSSASTGFWLIIFSTVQAGRPVKWMCFPNRKTPIGTAIDLYLRRTWEIVGCGDGAGMLGSREISMILMKLLKFHRDLFFVHVDEVPFIWKFHSLIFKTDISTNQVQYPLVN